MRRLLGSGTLILVTLAVILAVASIPLFTLYQSTCGRGEDERTEYSFVAPWNEPPADCRGHESGWELAKDALGLD